MVYKSVAWTRTKRYARLWLRDAVAETIAPLTDINARLNYIGVLVVLLVLLPHWQEKKQLAWFTGTYDALEAIVYSIPLFFLLNLFFAIFRIQKKEKQLGSWFGPRFIYHKPQQLLTVLVDEKDNGKSFIFDIKDAEDNAIISYAIETDRTDKRVKVELAWPNGEKLIDSGNPMNFTKGSVRLTKSRTMAIITNIEPCSTVTTVRVFMTGWEIGRGDGKG